MNVVYLKAFVLGDEIADKPEGFNQKHLQGAGPCRIECVDPLLIKFSFWAFIQLADHKAAGQARLSILRADSGRRYFFRSVAVQHGDVGQVTVFCIRLFDCIIPDRGVCFIELWYEGEWVIDQRLDAV